MVFFALAFGFAFLYLLLQCYYVFYWRKITSIEFTTMFIPATKLTVIVVARNEAANIVSCIQSILDQRYPDHLYEIIIVNDRSTDNTQALISKFAFPQIRLFNLSDFPEFIHEPAFKKSAIELAVNHASNELMVVTDADCIHDKDWLYTMAYAYVRSDAVMLTGPVQYVEDKRMLDKMQQMENLAFMVLTAAGIKSGLHDIANGANMAFKKVAFLEAGGYTGNYQYSSGDDMFLIEKMRLSYPQKVFFVKSLHSNAYSHTKGDWKSLIRQRIRWAGKNKGLKSPVINSIWGFVGFYHVMLLIAFIIPWFGLATFLPFVIMLVLKWAGDFIIIKEGAKYFKKESILIYFIPLQIMYSVYVFWLGCKLITGSKGDW